MFSDSASDGALRAGTLCRQVKSSIQLQLGTTQSIAEKKRCAGSRDAGNPFRGIKSSSFKAAPSAANTRAGARAAHSAAGHPPRSPSHPQDRQSRETRVESARRRHCCLRDGPSRGRCPPPASPVSAATRASDSPRPAHAHSEASRKTRPVLHHHPSPSPRSCSLPQPPIAQRARAGWAGEGRRVGHLNLLAEFSRHARALERIQAASAPLAPLLLLALGGGRRAAFRGALGPRRRRGASLHRRRATLRRGVTR